MCRIKFMELIEQINSHRYLYLDRLVEATDLLLEIWVDEARVRSESNLPSESSMYGSIETDEFCKRYKIIFDNYVGYSVINESFADRAGDDEFTGNLFRKYTKSSFLDYMSKAAIVGTAEDICESSCKHYEIVSLNQIIDVATCYEPVIEVIVA